MIDKMYKKAAGEFVVTEGQMGWFVSLENQCLCEVDFARRKGKILKYFGYTENGDVRYRGVIKCNDYLYVYPQADDNILVIDLNGEEVNRINIVSLPSSDKVYMEGKPNFRNAFIYEDYIFFQGYQYPALIRLDVETNQLEYITDCIDEINKRLEAKTNLGYFMEGCVVRGDKAYCAIGCIPGLLELDVNTLQSKIIDIETTAGGIAGITEVNDDVWCLTCGEPNANQILLWNNKTQKIEKQVEFNMPFAVGYASNAACHIGGKLYFPVASAMLDDFHEYDLEMGELSQNQAWEELDYRYHGNYLGNFTMMSVWVENNKTLHFATGKDFKWHEYNTDTEELISYDIFFDGTDEIYNRIFSDRLRVNRYTKGMFKEMEVPLEGLINCVLNN